MSFGLKKLISWLHYTLLKVKEFIGSLHKIKNLRSLLSKRL